MNRYLTELARFGGLVFMLQLTPKNYHSKEANLAYMGSSQYKSWLKCEAHTLNWLQSGCADEDTDALMAGKYVHAWAQGPAEFENFKAVNSGYIYNKKGEPYAPFKKADEMIEVLEADPKIRFYMAGAHEVILTASMFGVPWKVMIDVDNDPLNYLADLKTCKSISEWGWVWSEAESRNIKVSFVEEWQYMIQAAVYSEVERIARGRDSWKDFYIIAVSKEKNPDHAIIDLTDPARIETELALIGQNLPRILAVKSGAELPRRCEHCEYCRKTKRVGAPIHYTELREAY